MHRKRLARVSALCLLSAGIAMAQGVTLPDAERLVLDNGTILILNEKHDVPLLGLKAVLRGGAITDPDGKGGLTGLFASLIEKGAGSRDSAEFAEAIDSVGGRLSAAAELETINVTGEFLSRDADLMIELLADMLQRPALNRAELARLRDRTINSIRAAKDSDPGRLMPIYGNAFLFGEHPYGNPVIGNETSIANIRHADVLTYYEQKIGGDRLIIAVSGDFNAADMAKKLADAFGEWRPAGGEIAVVAAPAKVRGRRVLLIDKPGATQSYFWVGNVGVSRDYQHRADLDLANTVFGGRFTSMLNTALRLESGLTYGARSRLVRLSQSGSVAISSYAETGATIEAIDMALGVLGQLHDSGISAEMVSSARNYVLGQFPTDFETAAQLAAVFALLEAHGLDRSYIDDYGQALADVDPDSVATVIAEVYPRSADLVFVLLGDADVIRTAIAKYGAVTELAIREPRFRP